MLTPAALERFINQVCDPQWEPGYQQYKEHLRALKHIVEQSGERLEGNLFTEHLREEVPEEPIGIFRNKRSNYAVFCAAGNSLLEIGFNAGHSCMLALTINPDLVYTGVDIGMHSYTRPCYDYLRSVFGDRVRLHLGDSREVLPVLRGYGQQFDLFHLDGGHGFSIAQADLCNIIEYSPKGSTLLVDDVNDHMIASLCDFYVLRGRISRITLSRLWSETLDHEFFRIHPA
jgi:hypothetical protein